MRVLGETEVPAPSLRPNRLPNIDEAGGLIEQSLGFWLSYDQHFANAAIVLSALAALLLLWAMRSTANRANTLSFILTSQTDGDILRARKIFAEAANSHQRSSYYGREELDGDGADEKEKEMRDAIRRILNLNELTAVSILEGTMDERVFRRWFNKGYIKDYEDMTGYIEEVRKRFNNRSLFKEFEFLAKRWREDDGFYAKPGFFVRKWRAVVGFWNA